MARPKLPDTDRLMSVSARLRRDTIDRIAFIAEQNGLPIREMMRCFIDASLEANPIDELELARWKKSKSTVAKRAAKIRADPKSAITSLALSRGQKVRTRRPQTKANYRNRTGDLRFTKPFAQNEEAQEAQEVVAKAAA